MDYHSNRIVYVCQYGLSSLFLIYVNLFLNIFMEKAISPYIAFYFAIWLHNKVFIAGKE